MTSKQLLDLEGMIVPLTTYINIVATMSDGMCSNFFDEYSSISPKDKEEASCLCHEVSKYAAYGDVILDYSLKLKNQIGELKSLVSEIVMNDKEGSVAV